MPICNECTSPCNCRIDEDGPFSNRFDDGRRNTTVSGNGTEDNPYTIHFQQSGEYRPPSGEVKVDTVSTTTSIGKLVASADSPFVVWQSPVNVLAFFPGNAIVYLFERFNVVGASATFAAHATGERRLALFGTRVDGETNWIGGDVQHGNTSVATKLKTVGYSSGVITTGALTESRINAFVVGLYQTSGTTLAVTNIKFWVTTV